MITEKELNDIYKAQAAGAGIGIAIVAGWWALAEVGVAAYAATNGYAAFGFGSAATATTSGYLYANAVPISQTFMLNAGINLGTQHTINTIRMQNTLPDSDSFIGFMNNYTYSTIMAYTMDDLGDVGFAGFTGPLGRFNSLKQLFTARSLFTATGILGSSSIDFSLGQGLSTISPEYSYTWNGGKPKSSSSFVFDFTLALATGGSLTSWKTGVKTGGNGVVNWLADLMKNGGYSSSQSSFNYYQVREGDNLWKIGQNNGGVSVDSLLHLNPNLEPFIDKNGHRNAYIYKGDSIRIPNGQ